MKKLVFIAIITATIFSGCVKQKDCEGCVEGTLINLKEPYDALYWNGEKIYAYFIPDDINSIEGSCLTLYKKPPLKYRKEDTIKVCATYLIVHSTDAAIPAPDLSKFTCIEQ